MGKLLRGEQALVWSPAGYRERVARPAGTVAVIWVSLSTVNTGAGKTATPITAKVYLPENLVADMTMSQYLARLAAEATIVVRTEHAAGVNVGRGPCSLDARLKRLPLRSSARPLTAAGSST